MQKLMSLRKFFVNYKLFSFVLLAGITGVILQLIHQPTVSHWVLGGACAVAVLPLLWGMIDDIRTGRYGIDILAATAIITSVVLKEYWAGIVVVLMLTGGEALENYAERRAKMELTALLEHKPHKAHVLRGKKTVDVAASSVAANDKLVIMPGEVIPVDANILEGDTSVDESSLTGESMPVEKAKGDQIMSGAINIEGTITVQAIHSAKDSQYEQIIKLVKSASSGQSPFVRLADAYSIPFTIVSFMIAGTVWALTGEPIRFLEVIIVATPCPLLLAAPIALISGMSRAAKQGIIIKTGSALEKLAAAKTFAFDKTGTLTVGQPKVSSVKTYGKFSQKSILSYAAALEVGSSHVLAKAVVEAAEKQGATIRKSKQIKETAGHGLMGHIDGKDVIVGRYSLLKDNDISLPKEFKASQLKQTSTLVAVDGTLAGVILFHDEIRPESKRMLSRLKKAGIKHTAMVTGDNEATALVIAKELNITDVYPECLPSDKLLAIEGLPHWPIAFVGDGVNDAPVLTAADIGIALGARGSTAASESADVVIMLDDISKVSQSYEIAKNTFTIAKQSIMIGIFMSLGLMAIFATGKFQPVYGAAVQEVVDVAVIFNALRAHGPWKTRLSKRRLVKASSKA